MRHYKARVKVKGSVHYEEERHVKKGRKGRKIRYLSPAYEEAYLLHDSKVSIWLDEDLDIEDSLPGEVTDDILSLVTVLDPRDILYREYLGVEGDTITIEVKLKPHFNLARWQNPTVISKEYYQAAKVGPEALANPNLKPLSYWLDWLND